MLCYFLGNLSRTNLLFPGFEQYLKNKKSQWNSILHSIPQNQTENVDTAVLEEPHNPLSSSRRHKHTKENNSSTF